MSAESPAEYIERLRAENKALRRGLLEMTHEKQALEVALARIFTNREAARLFPNLDDVD